jgi:hypothetical protein
MCRKDHGAVVGAVVQFLDEDRAHRLQAFDDMAIVDDLVAHIDRRAILLERAFDDLDGPVDAGAEATEAPRTLLDIVATVESLGDAPHSIEQHRDDTVMLTFLTPTTLVELDFFEDHIEYSVFEKQAPPASWEALVAELEKFTRE